MIFTKFYMNIMTRRLSQHLEFKLPIIVNNNMSDVQVSETGVTLMALTLES
jgi:hypothetical protein